MRSLGTRHGKSTLIAAVLARCPGYTHEAEAFESLADFRCAFRVASVELYHHDHDGVWRVVDRFALGG